jgi:hypothetical protein
VESPVRGQLARRVRRAGTGKPTAETLYGVPSPTQQVQALDRTQPVLPIAVDVSEQRTHDYVRHGTTNLFAALNVGTGEIYGECKATRNGADFLAFLKAAVRLHEGKDEGYSHVLKSA